MMEINYSLLDRVERRESGEYVVRHAFYMRDFSKKNRKSRMYKGYHNTDYFGSNFITDKDLHLSENKPKTRTLTKEK